MSKMNVKVKTTEDGSGFITIDDLRPLFGSEIDHVEYYTVEMGENKELKIALYDKNKKLVLPNGEKPVK